MEDEVLGKKAKDLPWNSFHEATKGRMNELSDLVIEQMYREELTPEEQPGARVDAEGGQLPEGKSKFKLWRNKLGNNVSGIFK